MSENNAALQRYYKLHSKIYDATRWTFLFGRTELCSRIAALKPASICEIGCGTGINLETIAKQSPGSRLTGFDVSADMILQAEKRLTGKTGVVLKNEPFTASGLDNSFDVVFASYCLSMINPGFDQVLEDAQKVLKPGGRFFLVDFHASQVHAFRSWMRVNHVEMNAHLVPKMEQLFDNRKVEIRNAYAGLWEFVLFEGEKE